MITNATATTTFLFLCGERPPLRPTEQPIRQGDEAGGFLVGIVAAAIDVLDGVAGDTALTIKGEDEEAGEGIRLVGVRVIV